MSTEDTLIEACRSAPHDDAPRLVWADFVGGKRGELVVLQCDLTRGGFAPAEAAVRRQRERVLLDTHGREWTGLTRLLHDLGPWTGYDYQRGFVETAELEARVFAERGEELLQRMPLLRSLRATGFTERADPLDELRALLASPAFQRLHGLHLHRYGLQPTSNPYNFEGRGDEAARLLAESGALARLSELGMQSSGLTATGVQHLLASGDLRRIERLELGSHMQAEQNDALIGAVVALLARMPHLKAFDFSGHSDVDAFLPVLPPLVELRLSWLSDEALLAALGSTRAAATLEKLALTLTLTTRSSERGDGLRAFPRLRELALDSSRYTEGGNLDAVMRGLAGAPPSLRRLRLAGWHLSANALRMLARSIGSQLEELDLRTSSVDDLGVIQELRAYVAGEVHPAYQAPQPVTDQSMS